MKEFVDEFKVELKNLMDNLYQDLEGLVDSTMFNMSFCDGDSDEHYAALQDAMIEVIQEQLCQVFGDMDES